MLVVALGAEAGGLGGVQSQARRLMCELDRRGSRYVLRASLSEALTGVPTQSISGIYAFRTSRHDEWALPQVVKSAEGRFPTVLRCATTDDARRLGRKAMRLQPHRRAGVVFHCLNHRSVKVLSADLRGRALLQGNTLTSSLVPQPFCETPRYVYAGRDAPSKNLDRLVDEWGRLGPHVLELYGPPSLRRLESACVRYVGMYDGVAPLRAGDLFFLPTFREGHPSVLVEAAAKGAVVAASDVHGVREHIDGMGGVHLGRPASAVEMRSGIEAALALTDVDRRSRSQKSREFFLANWSRPWSSAYIILNSLGVV